MEYENMRLAELKALTRERGLRGFSRLGKAELIALLYPPPQSVRFRPDRAQRVPALQRLRQQQLDERLPEWGASTSRPSPQEMDIFEQQEMSK